MNDLQRFDEMVNDDELEMTVEEIEEVVSRIADNEVDDLLMDDAENCAYCDALRMESAGVYCPKHSVAHCTKCGDEVLGDTDGLCINCI